MFQAAGLATMISTMRPDIDNMDEYVRNTTARAFAVVASALGIPSLLPFLKAVCKSKKSWQARHTGIKIVQQIAILMGCAILPHLRSLVEIIEHGELLSHHCNITVQNPNKPLKFMQHNSDLFKQKSLILMVLTVVLQVWWMSSRRSGPSVL